MSKSISIFYYRYHLLKTSNNYIKNKNYLNDGLNNLLYNITFIKENRWFTWLLVRLPPPPKFYLDIETCYDNLLEKMKLEREEHLRNYMNVTLENILENKITNKQHRFMIEYCFSLPLNSSKSYTEKKSI